MIWQMKSWEKNKFHSVTLTKEYYLEEETSGNFDTDLSKGYGQINHRLPMKMKRCSDKRGVKVGNGKQQWNFIAYSRI